MSKGEETKNRILFVARDLFYEYGFHKTTARMISEKANTNLGLLNYYFKNKNEMGLIIYSSIRDRFDELIAEYFPDMDELMLFLFSSTLELYLCITNEKYGNFFHEFIGGEPKNRRFIQEHISDVFCRYSSEYAQTPEYTMLATISISAIKPAGVDYVLNHKGEIKTDTYLRYYLEQQLHFLGHNKSEADSYIEKVHQFYISVAPRFTPVMTPLV